MKISKGDLIIHSKPFAYKLSSEWRGIRCETCLNKNESLKKCAKCKITFYCNKQCQSASWNEHRQECTNISRVSKSRQIKSDELLDMVTLLVRIYRKLEAGGDKECEVIGNISRTFSDLQSHSEEILKDGARSTMTKTVCIAFSLFTRIEMPFDLVIDLFGKVIINSLSIMDEFTGDEIGTGIYLGPSALDHSCRPNAIYIFDGINLIVRSTENCENFDISKVFVPYIQTMDAKESRLKKLLDQYYFVCECPWCIDDAMDKQMMSIRCENQACQAPVYIRNDECEKCGTLVVAKKRAEVLALVEELRSTCSKAHQLKKEKRFDDALHALGQVMNKAGPILHPWNVDYVHGAEEAMDICLLADDNEQSLVYSVLALPAYRIYYGDMSPMLANLLMRLGGLQFFYGYVDEGRKNMLEAKHIFGMLFGDENPFIARINEYL